MITKAIEQGFIAEKDPILAVNIVWASLHGTKDISRSCNVAWFKPREENARMSENKLTITAICGSLREGSFNRRVLKAVKELAPKHWEIHHVDLLTIPLIILTSRAKAIPSRLSNLKKAFEKRTVY
jgi:hypothetical protein